jgi:hypothetical protein
MSIRCNGGKRKKAETEAMRTRRDETRNRTRRGDVTWSENAQQLLTVTIQKKPTLQCDHSPRSQSFSPAKEFFIGIRVILEVSKSLLRLLVAYSCDIQTPGREECYDAATSSHKTHPSLRAHSCLSPAIEKLHSDPTNRRIDGATWEDYGAITFRSRIVDKYDGGQGDQ